MSDTTTGQCACGDIRYSTTGAPQFSVICHCRQCQRISGAGHGAQFAVAVETTRLEGEVQFYEQTADSGNRVSCGFCGNCGSPVLKKTTKLPELYFFHAATMDNPELYKPEVVVDEDAKQPWDWGDPELPRG